VSHIGATKLAQLLTVCATATGLKRMDDGSLLKDYAEKEKETEQAIQMAVRQVAFEDERYLVSLPDRASSSV
jgi:hypothetical protein